MISALVASLGLVTFDTLAARVPVVLEKLSKVVGQKLECDSSFTNEVVVVHVKGVELGELLDKFAFANVGQWRKEKDKFVLVPDAKRRAEQEREFYEKRVKSIQRILGKFKEELSQPYTAASLGKAFSLHKPMGVGVSAEKLEMVGPDERLNPIARVGMNALLSLGARHLAGLTEGRRIVVSSEPTAMQEKWSGSDRLISQFLREWPLFNEEVSKAPVGERISRLAWESRRGIDVDPRTISRIGKIWVGISDLLSNRADHQVVVGIESPQGQLSIGKGLNISVAAAPVTPPDLTSIPTTPLNLSEISKEMVALRRGVYDNQHERTSLKISERLSQHLNDPIGSDPLWFTSELYGQYADARAKNLIAVINDGAFQRFLLDPKSTDARTFHQRSLTGFTFVESGQWLVMTSSSPHEARRNRDDRMAIRDLVHSVTGDNFARLKARSVYALQRPFGVINGPGAIIAGSLSPIPMPERVDGDEDLLRLFGSLTPDQERDLLQGKALNFAGLSVRQRTLLNRMVFGERIRQWSMELGSRPLNELQGEGLSMVGPWNEPTESLPNGIPDQAPLTFLSRKVSDLELHNSQMNIGYSFASRGLSPALSQVARQIFYDQHPELAASIYSIPSHKPDLFIGIDRLRVTFQLNLERDLVWRGNLGVESPVSGRVKLDQLPKQHRDAIEIEVARFNEMLKNGVKFGSGSPLNLPKKQPPPR